MGKINALFPASRGVLLAMFLMIFFLSGCPTNETELADIAAVDTSSVEEDGASLDLPGAKSIDTVADNNLLEDVSPRFSDINWEDKPSIKPVPPGDTSPGDVSPGEVKPDVPCPDPPVFSENCKDVPYFESGFIASCIDGVLYAQWYIHHFCNDQPTPQQEQIIEYSCSFACPNGCQEGEISYWPSSGLELVELFCNECDEPADCKGLPHEPCEGNWECKLGSCEWSCLSVECVEEGGYVSVLPNAPQCCPGLVPIPDCEPGLDGKCNSDCGGGSICTYCGNGECGLGENICNCPMDCLEPPPEKTECEQQGGVCVPWNPFNDPCPPGTKPTGLPCKYKSEVCCQKSEATNDCGADFFSCGVDSDCVKTDASCCPCSMGGTSIAVNANCVDEWKESLNCPPNPMCIALYNCDNSVPACINGKCKLLPGNFKGANK